jgi:predicted  nucleic acid-binding Zn-ribbon protein
MWSEELKKFVDELYYEAQFEVLETRQYGNDLNVTRFRILSTKYQGQEINITAEIDNMEQEVQEMDQWWAEYTSQPPENRTTLFPSHKYESNLMNWMEVNDMLYMNIRSNDLSLVYLDEIAKRYKFGEAMEMYYIYLRQIKWAKVKLKFLYYLKETLEKRQSAERVILDGSAIPIYAELAKVASTLGIRNEVDAKLQEEFGGKIWEFFSTVKDIFMEMKRSFLYEPRVWHEYYEKVKVINDYLEGYTKLWNLRKTLEQLFDMDTEEKLKVRLLTGPDFLTGDPQKDLAIGNEWYGTISEVYQNIKEVLEKIKKKYTDEPFEMEKGSYDYTYLRKIASAEIVKKIYIWNFRHIKNEDEKKKEFYQNGARRFETKKNELITQYENYYKLYGNKKLNKIEKNIYTSKQLSEKVKKSCQKAVQDIDQFKSNLATYNKNIDMIEKELTDIKSKSTQLKKQTVSITQDREKITKKGIEVANLIDEIEALSKKVCKKTLSLSDASIEDHIHEENYIWILQQKSKLKELNKQFKNAFKELEKIKTRSQEYMKTKETFNSDNRQRIDNSVKAFKKLYLQMNTPQTLPGTTPGKIHKNYENTIKLKTESIASLKKEENKIAGLKNLYLGQKKQKKIKSLREIATHINTIDCSNQVKSNLNKIEKEVSQANHKADTIIKKYNKINQVYEESMKNIKILQQEKDMIDLNYDFGKAYNNKRITVTGYATICMVEAQKLMQKSFVPNVVGLPYQMAIEQLHKHGFFTIMEKNLGEAPTKKLDNIVTSQSPLRVKRVAKSTKVVLTYYDKYKTEEEKEKELKDKLMAEKICPTNMTKKWDALNKKVDCKCIGPVFVWNYDHTQCITQQEADEEQKRIAMASINCSKLYDGSINSWNEISKKVECVCLGPVLVWNKNKTACITQKEAALENLDCSRWPGSMPGYQNGKASCICKPGLVPNKAGNACITEIEAAYENANCQNGMVPVLTTDQSVICQCPPNKWWVEEIHHCVTFYEWDRYCKQNYPGSEPGDEWQACKCPANTNRNPITHECVPDTPPAPPPPSVVRTGKCNSVSKNGGNKAERFVFDLYGVSEFIFEYETYDIKDRVLILEENHIIFDSGCIGTHGWKKQYIHKQPYSSQIYIDIQPNCANSHSTTKWKIKLNCP